MKGFDVFLELQEDFVASASSATEGAHRGLDYIPGAKLLGAAAQSLYAQLGKERAFDVFHSGKVRFGNAYPANGEESSFPMPLCWHERKAESAEKGGRILPERLLNMQHAEGFDDGSQPKQLRSGYITRSGALVRPVLSLRLKTAIDPATRRAASAQLFCYQSIPAGTKLRASVAADDVMSDVLDRLAGLYAGTLIMGRSGTAEYGSVRCRVGTWSVADAGATNGLDLCLWFLSDAALQDDRGMPTAEPLPAWLGLTDAQASIDWSKTFLRFRRYAPYNAARRAYDMERALIAQGSVLGIRLTRPLGEEELTALAGGVGIHRECGLGQVWINPPLLADRQPRFASPPVGAAKVEDAATSGADHPLIQWLRARAGQAGAANEHIGMAESLAAELSGHYRAARAFAGADEGMAVGPSPSQWGTVLAAAKAKRRETSDLLADLFEGEHAICKASAPGWGECFYLERARETRTFAQWLRDVLQSGDPRREDPRFVAAFARIALDIARKERRQ